MTVPETRKKIQRQKKW